MRKKVAFASTLFVFRKPHRCGAKLMSPYQHTLSQFFSENFSLLIVSYLIHAGTTSTPDLDTEARSDERKGRTFEPFVDVPSGNRTILNPCSINSDILAISSLISFGFLRSTKKCSAELSYKTEERCLLYLHGRDKY